jgi:hypothetical protein
MTFIPRQQEKQCFIACSEDKVNAGLCDCINRIRNEVQNPTSYPTAVSGSLPTLEQSKKAMLRRKTKFVDNMDKFSSRKNAYKEGWKDCYEWVMSKGNDQ